MYLLRLARLGQTMEEGVLTEWRKSQGEAFLAGDFVYDVTTEKATMEVEATRPGRIVHFVAQPGDVVPVGGLLAIIAEGDEVVSEADIQAALQEETDAVAPSETSSVPAVPAAAEVSPPADVPAGKVVAAPAARRLAAELGVDLMTVTASKADGVISVADVRKAAGIAG